MIRASNVLKLYRMGETTVRALDGVDLQIGRGEFVSITGASGSGKSTLMHILGCLDRPSSGLLELNGHLVSNMSDKQLAEVRNRDIGFVFQTFNLINRTSALDNVVVPLVYTRGRVNVDAAKRALDRVGLLKRAKHRPSEMSGGECQRVAIARAIVNNPSLILADEPTGNLDSRTSEQIMQIFHQLHADGITIILVTHEPDIAIQAARMIHMHNGKIVEDKSIDDREREAMIQAGNENFRAAGRRAGPAKPDAPVAAKN